MIDAGSTVLSFIAGLKFAVFLAVLTLAFLVDQVSKNKHVHGLNLMAGSLTIVAFAELLHLISNLHGEVFMWFMSYGNVSLITYPLYVISAIGIMWYFIGIKKNLKNYM